MATVITIVDCIYVRDKINRKKQLLSSLTACKVDGLVDYDYFKLALSIQQLEKHLMQLIEYKRKL